MGIAVYQFPATIGDVVYTVYAGRIYPCKVTGFQITGQGKYVYIQYPDVDLSHPVLLSHICLSLEEAENKVKKKEEQMYEEGTDGRT